MNKAIRANVKRLLKSNKMMKRHHKRKRKGAGAIKDIAEIAGEVFKQLKNLPTPLEVIEFAKKHFLSIPQAIKAISSTFLEGKQWAKDVRKEIENFGKEEPGWFEKLTSYIPSFNLSDYGGRRIMRKKHKRIKRHKLY